MPSLNEGHPIVEVTLVIGHGNLTILKQTVESLVAFEASKALRQGRCSRASCGFYQTTPKPRRSQDI